MVAALKNVDFPQLGLPARARVIMYGSSFDFFEIFLLLASDAYLIIFLSVIKDPEGFRTSIAIYTVLLAA
jgi:hypothetical protein